MIGPLKLFFLRHGRADRDQFHGGDDRLRPLVDEGKRRTHLSAGFLAELGLTDLEVVLTSPLVRARQTADIAATRLGLSSDVVEDSRLGFGFDGRALMAMLNDLPGDPRRIMLVGHEPGLSHVIGELTGGDVVMRKGALARVDLHATSPLAGELVWLLQPRVLLSAASAGHGGD